jgi:uncharacterized membrane protein YdbT with pleckstrin-like domain
LENLYIFFLTALSIKAFLTIQEENFELFWRIIVLAGITYFGYLYLSHKNTTYTLNALEVMGTSGVFSRKTVRIPLNRITNYESSSTFLERLLGINNVMIDTPGGTGFELSMTRLLKKDSELVVGHLRFLIGQQKIAEAGSNQKLKSLRQKAVSN